MTTQITKYREKYFFLSNMYMKDFMCKNILCPSAEHIYQASKAKYKSDFCKIMNFRSPFECKKFGKTVIKRDDWSEEFSLKVMEEILICKFQDPVLKQLLIETGNSELIEGNNWGDTFWGVDEKRGGKNHLGLIQMKIRDIILSTT